MRSIGARQGAFCFGYFYLGKQIKVTRTAVRNPKSIKPLPLIQTLAVSNLKDGGTRVLDVAQSQVEAIPHARHA
jgi:hypothetical protein